MIRISLNVLLIVLVLASCKKIDNYDRPNGGIYGMLIDQITGEGLQTEQPNGYTVRLFEKGGRDQSPITFFGKPDGSYENALIFQNEYRVIPSEGAFFPVDTAVVQIGSRTERNFDVVPFLALTNVNITASAGTITSTYQIARSQVGGKIIEAKTLVSKIPTVNNIVFNYVKAENLSAVDDLDILAGSRSDQVTSVPAGTYYVRVAARTNNPLNKYNYSKTFTVTVP